MTVLNLIVLIVVFGGLALVLISNKPNDAHFGDAYKYSFQSGNTGIGVCPERRILKLVEGSKSKEYSFAMIRSWESNLQTGGVVVGSGFAAANANLANGMANKRASGFFVYTKDLDNTTWRIKMFKKNDQNKWMEILQQNVNES